MPKKLTPTEIGKMLGLSRARASQMVNREGCPQTNKKDILEWRRMREAKREPTNAKSCKFAEDRVKPMKAKKPSNTGDTLLDAKNNSVIVALTAFEAYQDAIVHRLPTRSARLSEHSKAIDAQLKAEKAYREESERRGVLVVKTDITETCKRCLDTVLTLVKKLPIEQGPQCNPTEANMAVKILQRAADDIIEAGRKVLLGLS